MTSSGSFQTEQSVVTYKGVNLCFYVKSTFKSSLRCGLVWKDKSIPKRAVIIELDQDVKIFQITYGVTTLAFHLAESLKISPDATVVLPSEFKPTLKKYLEMKTTLEGPDPINIFHLLRAFVGITLGENLTLSEYVPISLNQLFAHL